MLRVFTFDMDKIKPAEATMWVQYLQKRFHRDEIVAFPRQLGHMGYSRYDYLQLKEWIEAAQRKLKEMEVWYEDKSKRKEISANDK